MEMLKNIWYDEANMKILITGAAGFVGTNITLELLKKGFDVIAVDSLTRPGSEKNLEMLKGEFSHLNFLKKEIEDVPGVIAQERPDLIYHFAAQVGVRASVESPIRDFKINAAGTFHITQAAGKTPVIYTSTNKVFGDNVNGVPIEEFETRYDFGGEYRGKGISETFSVDARHHTPYGCSKLVGDIYVRESGGVVNRCSCMFGENQFGMIDQGWLSHFALNKLKDRPTVIFGDGKQVRDILHKDDVVRLLLKQGELLINPFTSDKIRGEVFNLGGGHANTISLLELCDKWDIEPTFEDWRPADQKVFYCDISKAKRLLDWEPQVNVDDGLKRLFEWTGENHHKIR